MKFAASKWKSTNGKSKNAFAERRSSDYMKDSWRRLDFKRKGRRLKKPKG